MDKWLKKYGLVLGLAVLLLGGFTVLSGLPQNVDIFVKDSNGNAVSGAYCYITNPPGCSSGLSSCQMKATSNAAGYCHFTGLVGGEVYSWGVSCGTANGITKQGSVTTMASNSLTYTSNVYVTLSGCSGTTPSTTTTTVPGCSATSYSNKCYNGDVWKYDNCGNRISRTTICSYGCTGGACNGAPTTTTLRASTTTTAAPATSSTLCYGLGCGTTTTTLPGSGSSSNAIWVVAVMAAVVAGYYVMKK